MKISEKYKPLLCRHCHCLERTFFLEVSSI